MKTESNLNEKVQDYLNKTSKHLFTIDSEYINKLTNEFYKVIPVTINDKLHYIKLRFNEKEAFVQINNTDYIISKNIFGSNFKDSIFPKYSKHTSIKKTRKFEEKFNEIKRVVDESSSDTLQNLTIKIKNILVNNE